MLNFANIKNTTQNTFKSHVVAYDRSDNTFTDKLDKYFDAPSFAQISSSVQKLRANGEKDEVVIKADPSIPQDSEIKIQVKRDNIVKSMKCLPKDIINSYQQLVDKIKEQLSTGQDTGLNKGEKIEQELRILTFSSRGRNISLEITNPEVLKQAFDVDTLRMLLDQLFDIRVQAAYANHKVTASVEKDPAGENSIRLTVIDKANKQSKETSSKPLEVFKAYQNLVK